MNSPKHNIKTNTMKKTLLFLLLFTGMVNAQIVNIPDANFKANLIALGIDTNSDGEIQNSEALAVTGTLELHNFDIIDLTGISSFTNITVLDLSTCKNLTSADLHGLVNLRTLFLPMSKKFTSLYVKDSVNLTMLSSPETQLTSLDLQGLVNISFLDLRGNQLTSLDLQGLVNISYLDLSGNQLTSLDLTDQINLGLLYCGGNQLTSLDLTNQINLEILAIDGNNNLSNLFIKNTKLKGDGKFTFSINPNLQYICADESQLEFVQSKIDEYGYTNCQVNTYCSFVPGGAYNTIKGNCKLDSNNNGCDASDVSTANLKIKINDGTTDGFTYINATGDYAFYTEAGSFTISPQFENPAYFTVSPTDAVVTFPTVTSETKLQDFCITANGVHPDLEVD